MTKVRIDTPGVTVEIEADDTLNEVTDKALKTFHEAGGWPQQQPGRVLGFQVPPATASSEVP